MGKGLTEKTLLLSACGLALTLGGCGGGGASDRPEPIAAAPQAPPPPAPPVTPTPAPPPSNVVNYDDAEYQRSNGANAHQALAAYDAGGTGKGVKIAIVDSGINPDLADFAGRIDPASRDVAANRGVTDDEGHGTAVAGVAAAGRNGTQILGVAFDATILSLNTANPNDCDSHGCTHSDSDIAEAVDIARTNGARVINISLGGDSVGSNVLSAISRATAAGIVVVVSAGNDSAANPDGFALDIAGKSGNGLVIIAGAMNGSGQMASFSNQAGNGSQYYLTALGDRVRTFDQTGTAYLYSGTSFSAPVISGAAALLASAFPNLSGQQIVELLLNTADDAGAAGRDAVFGNGVLNIARAFEPQGKTTLAGTSTPVSVEDNGQTSDAMGDAGTAKPAGVVILDGYSRAYALNLARTLSRAPAERPLSRALMRDLRSASASAGRTAIAVTIDSRLDEKPLPEASQMGLTYDDSRRAKLVAGLALSRITPQTAVAIGFSESGKALQQRLSGQEQNAFLVARDPMSRVGFTSDDASAIGIRHNLGPAALTLTSERGKIYDPDRIRGTREPGYALAAITLDRRFGPAHVAVTASRLEEDATLLGGRFSTSFASGGATSTFADVSATFELGGGWDAFASYRRGWTSIAGSGASIGNGRLTSDAFAFDVSKRGALLAGDQIALRIMQPLRVRSGGFTMTLPTSYDYGTGQAGFENRLFSLTPSGREIDVELGYGVGLWGGSLSLNSFVRRQPGHIAAASADVGGAVRFSLNF